MRRFEERKQDLLNATERLKEALKQEENDIVIDCVLHRFEFTFRCYRCNFLLFCYIQQKLSLLS